jgi:hypothetical protein
VGDWFIGEEARLSATKRGVSCYRQRSCSRALEVNTGNTPCTTVQIVIIDYMEGF